MRESTIHVLHLGTVPRVAGGRQTAASEYYLRLRESRLQEEIKHTLAIVRGRHQCIDWEETARRLGIEWHDVVQYGRCDLTVLWRLARLARKSAVNVVHAHDPSSQWLALLLQPLVGFRIVATAAGWSAGTWRQRILAGMDRKLLPGFDRIIAANNQLARQLCLVGCRPQQIDVIHGGVDTEEFSRKSVRGNLRDELRLSTADRVVGINATCTEAAEAVTILEAVRFAQSELGPLHVLIFGADAIAEQLSARFNGSGLEGRIHVLNHRDDLPSVYAALDVLVLTGSATANALFEAQSMEVPIVAADAVGIGEMIEDGTTGIVIEDDQPQFLGTALTRVLSDHRSSASLAAAGRLRICQRFRFDDLLAKVAGTYRRAWAQS